MTSLGPIIRDTSANSVAIVVYGKPDNNNLSYGVVRIRSNNDPWITKTLRLKSSHYYG
jgi:hypothetical protein